MTKKKPLVKTTDKAVTAPERSAESVLADGGLLSALSFQEVTKISAPDDGSAVDNHHEYYAAMNAQADRLNAGDMSGLVSSLNTQFRLMETQVVKMVSYASAQQNIKNISTLMTLALRLQSACRNTAQTICDLKNPRTANFIRTGVTNIAGEHQQVNNYGDNARAQKEKPNLSNELEEVHHAN